MSGGPLEYLIRDSRNLPGRFFLQRISANHPCREAQSQHFMMTRVFGPPAQIVRTGSTPYILPKRLHPSRANLRSIPVRRPPIVPKQTYRRLGEVIRFASILKWYIPLSPSEPGFRVRYQPPSRPVFRLHRSIHCTFVAGQISILV